VVIEACGVRHGIHVHADQVERRPRIAVGGPLVLARVAVPSYHSLREQRHEQIGLQIADDLEAFFWRCATERQKLHV
jgi:hypothetical protein